MTFDEWWVKLQEMAFEVEHELGEQDEYFDYFDDGDTPEDVLATEMNRMDDEVDSPYVN